VKQLALIGAHPDGLRLARTLLETGAYRLAAIAGPPAAFASLAPWGSQLVQVTDVEEVLARNDLDWVVVADELRFRPEVLRRAVQSERDVLCVHPVDLLPDIAYEAAMIQQDTRKVLLPLLTERFAPALIRLRQLCQEGALGPLRMIEYERRFPHLAEPPQGWEASPLVSLWDGLRLLGGDIRDVSALADREEELQPNDSVTLTGRFERGGLFQVVLLPGAGSGPFRLVLRGGSGQAELTAPEGIEGPMQLRYTTPDGPRQEDWEAWDPAASWCRLVQDLDRGQAPPLDWLDGIRCLELFDAAQQSVARRRVVPLLYEEFSEVSTFKGAMTSLGCGLLCLALLVFLVGVWLRLPRAALYGMVGCLLAFLGLQFLRWLVPEKKTTTTEMPDHPA
jgi:predicted dehydrogenase